MEETTPKEAQVPLMTSLEGDDVQLKTDHQTESERSPDEETQYEEEEEDREDPVYEPPDGGWGWMVVFGTTICTMMMATQGPCFGIFYGDRLRELGGTPTLAAWLFNFQSLTWNLAGPWAGLLGEKFGYRPIAMISSFTAASSLILSALVSNPYHLLFTFSIFSGIGGGICINCCYLMSAKYFKRRLGLANGIMVTGGSLGLMLMPQMASKLQQLYPFEWANLIAGAVMMNAVAATMLFHPVEWHAKKTFPQAKENGNASSAKLDKESKAFDSRMKVSTLPDKVRSDNFPRCASVPHNLVGQAVQKFNPSPGLTSRRKRTISETPYLKDWTRNDSRGLRASRTLENSKISIFEYSGSTIMGSVLTLHQSHHEPNQENKDDMNDGKGVDGHHPEKTRKGIWKKFLSHYQPSVLRDPLVISVALFTCITITAALNMFSTMPFVLNDAGYDLQSAASAMSIAAVADLVTRMMCAAITDMSWVKPRVLYGVAQVIFIVVPFALINGWHHWWVVLLCMTSIGIGLGILYALDVFIIVRLLGVQKLQSVFGMSQLFRVFAFLSLGPIGGVLRDATGSYASAIFFFTSAIFLALLIMLFTAFYTCCHSRASTQTQPF